MLILPCDLSLITIHISHCHQFTDIHILQSSVVTYLRCSEIFKYEFIANVSLSLSVKEFRKSVNIRKSYGHELRVLFFIDSQCSFVLFLWQNQGGHMSEEQSK